MKKFRTLTLFAILFIGFHFQNCSDNDLDCDCGELEGEYFDIKDFELSQFSKSPEEVSYTMLNENDAIDFDDYSYLVLNFKVDYISQINKEQNWYEMDFSTMSSAYGCSCLANGYEGSKNEGITSFQIITINDYNDEYLAGDTVNDLFEMLFTSSHSGQEELSSYLERSSELVESQTLYLRPKMKPSLSTEFQVKINIELSTGESYESTTLPIFLN